MRRYYRLIISRPTGGVNNYPFNTLISCKTSARKIGKPGDRIIIYEIFEDEQNTKLREVKFVLGFICSKISLKILDSLDLSKILGSRTI